MIGRWPEIRSGMLSFNSLTESVSVAPRVDCMTTKVAIAAQYASDICTSRGIMTDKVAATAVRVACAIQGRFFLSQAHNLMNESSSLPVCVGKVTIFYLQRGSGDHLPSGIPKSHARVVAAGSLRRISSSHE